MSFFSGGNNNSGPNHSPPQLEPGYSTDDSIVLDCCRPTPAPTSLNAPEKNLTRFAFLLAIIEKTASRIGQLAFVWATVVLLGGFASTLKPKDFWIITAILVVEGFRLISRSHELEWQHQSTRLLPTATRPTTLRYRSQSHLSAPRSPVPARNLVFVSKNISLLLYWQPIFVTAACAALSLMRLRQQDYGDDRQTNKKSALNLFYSLASVEALTFLLEKLYWIWRIDNLVKLVCVKRVLGEMEDIGIVSIRRFFYDAYSKCIDGSIFDGLKMDLVSFAEELLKSDSPYEQFIGARILQLLVKNEQFTDDTLR